MLPSALRWARSGLELTCAAATTLGLLAALCSPVSAAGLGSRQSPMSAPPSIAALHTEDDLRVDGVFDEAAWSTAMAGGGFVQHDPYDGVPATEDTEIRVLYTSSTLYVAVIAHDSKPEAITAREMSRDGALRRDDSIILLLDTFHDGRNAYFFETNPNGARGDALITDEGRDVNFEWDGIWAVASRTTATGWQAEFAIPFSTLRYEPGLETWGLQVSRQVQRLREESFWAPAPREADVFRMSLAGDLTGIDLRSPSRQLDVKPYIVAAARQDEETDTSSEDADLGLDIKWGITRGLTLDLTYNTDFAEVEVDDQRVNLTRFSLFFPEKREFFLENAGIFEFGQRSGRRSFGSPLLKIFFSRRIGLVDGERVPIEWGTRLTGRMGEWSLGVLDVQTDSLVTEELDIFGETNFGVVRVKRNLGERSSIGAIYTRRSERGAADNQVYGIDADWNPTDRINVNGFFAQSDDDDLRTSDDTAVGAKASFEGRELTAGLEVQQIEGDFNPEVGFLLREDIRRYKPQIEWNPRIEKAGIRSLSFEIQSEYVEKIDGPLESHNLELTYFGVRTFKNDGFRLRIERDDERLFEEFEISDGVIIAPGRYTSDPRFGIFGFTSEARLFSMRGGLERGGFLSGDRDSVFLRLAARPSKFFRASTGYSYNMVDLPEGQFSTHVVNQRFDVSFTPDLLWNSTVQWNDANDTLGINLRLNWIYRPGADLFVVYNQTWDTPAGATTTTRDRAFLVKFTYLFRG